MAIRTKKFILNNNNINPKTYLFMKKITSLFAALMAVVAVNAATVTFGSADLSTDAMTKSGVTVTPAKENGQTAPGIYPFEGVNTLRVYAKGSLTFDAGTDNITSITLKLNSSTNGKRLTTMTSDAGEVTVKGDPDWTATWTNAGVNKVVFTVGDKATLGSEGDTKAGQIHIMEIIVVTDGEGGGNEGGDEEEGDYSFEPTEVTTINETMISADYQTIPDYNLIDLYMESETANIDLWLFADDVANGIPAGTYTINNSMESNTAMASPGGDELYDYPCYLATNFNADGYYTAAYYLTAGTVTITKDAANYKVVVAATSYNGSTINATYEGEIEEYIADGVENVEASALNIRMNNGNLIVGAEAGEQVSVYNVAGQMLYNTIATGETTIRGLQANQVVVVRVADKAAKVIL